MTEPRLMSTRRTLTLPSPRVPGEGEEGCRGPAKMLRRIRRPGYTGTLICPYEGKERGRDTRKPVGAPSPRHTGHVRLRGGDGTLFGDFRRKRLLGRRRPGRRRRRQR